ncbi:MAG: class I SAM-dependent methyltransferase [Flavobacterium sp.]|nr:class I SAM-dependent methyltransferase [Flavobacterium sp.]MDP5026842.1 class I SAM-dependent methyltransferase [Flavobacterium sp.]
MKADFDPAAKNYDTHFTHSEIGKLQRKMVYGNLQNKLKKVKKLLEINCGTGEDAIWLAKQGIEVTATDISEEMIAIAQSKSSGKNPNFNVLDINKISKKSEKFDMIFSNFGGLNCLTKSELELFFNSAKGVLSDNGKMCLVIMSKNTLCETLYFLLKLDFKNAFRRKREVVFANVEGEKVATYYYNPKDIVHLCQSNFEIVETKPIGFFIPPSYLEPFFKNKKSLLYGLDTLENKIRNWSFLSKFADHYIITLQKK